MEYQTRTYIGLTTDDGYLVLQGGARIDVLEMLNRAEIAEALSVALTIKFSGYVFAQWEDSIIEISGCQLPAKMGPGKFWTLLDKLSPHQAILKIKEVAEDPSARSQILATLANGRDDQTLFEDSDGEVCTLSYLQQIGCVADSVTEDDRYYIDVYPTKTDDKKMIARREFASLSVAESLVKLFNEPRCSINSLAS